MSSPEPISDWITQVRGGDASAIQKLWENYFPGLVGLARKKLQGMPRRAADEEDVALSAFDSFCRGAEQGRFPSLLDQDNLWPLLVVITTRKALQLRRYEQRQKRGGGAVRGDSAFQAWGDAGGEESGLEQIIGGEPTPEFAAQMVEEYQELLGQLTEPTLRSVAVWKMEGYSNEEIAAKLGCVLRTVERKLHLIRSLWSQNRDR